MLRSGLRSRPYVIEWIDIIRTELPVGERLVFRVSLTHRVIECFVLGIPGGVASFDESQKEALRFFGPAPSCALAGGRRCPATTPVAQAGCAT
jgi:hypothetical protein